MSVRLLWHRLAMNQHLLSLVLVQKGVVLSLCVSHLILVRKQATVFWQCCVNNLGDLFQP